MFVTLFIDWGQYVALFMFTVACVNLISQSGFFAGGIKTTERSHTQLLAV